MQAHSELAGTWSGGYSGGGWRLRRPSISCEHLEDVCACMHLGNTTGGCVFVRKEGV